MSDYQRLVDYFQAKGYGKNESSKMARETEAKVEAVRVTDKKIIGLTFQDAVSIVYGGICKHEWFEGRCIHCNLTSDFGTAIREATAKIGVEHVRTVDCERKNKSLIAKNAELVDALNQIACDDRTPIGIASIARAALSKARSK
jgi:ribosomal protein L19